MNVLRTIPSFYPKVTGPAYQASQITHGLRKRGHEGGIFTSTAGAENEPATDTVDGIPVRRFDSLPIPFPYEIMPQAPPALWRTDADVIHAHSYRNFLSDSAYVISQRRKIPFVLHAHGTLLGYKSIIGTDSAWPYRAYDALTRKRVVKNADAVVVSTSEEYDEAVEFGVAESKIHSLPVGKDVNRYTAIPRNPPEDRFRLLFVGRLDPSRNVEQLIEALSSLPIDITLRVVGGEVQRSNASEPGYLDRLKSICEGLGVTNRVTFTGPKYDGDLIEEYRMADLFVYTSNYENFGQTMLEAGAAGLPVVATPEGVAVDIVRDGQTGYLVPHGDPEAVADAIQQVRDRGSREMGQRLQDRVKADYKWETIIDDYVELYRDLTS